MVTSGPSQAIQAWKRCKHPGSGLRSGHSIRPSNLHLLRFCGIWKQQSAPIYLETPLGLESWRTTKFNCLLATHPKLLSTWLLSHTHPQLLAARETLARGRIEESSSDWRSPVAQVDRWFSTPPKSTHSPSSKRWARRRARSPRG